MKTRLMYLVLAVFLMGGQVVSAQNKDLSLIHI